MACGMTLSLCAAETNSISTTNSNTNSANQIELLQAQIREMQANFERVQAEQRRQIDVLSRKVDELSKAPPGGTNIPAVPVPSADQKKLESELASELGGGSSTNAAATTNVVQRPAWSPAQPIPVFRAGSAYMNVSFDALINAGWSTASDPGERLELGDHDPMKRGFSMRNAEIALDGAVDPYFKGFANLVFKLDKNNETESELEETYFQTADLPGNFQVKGGQFFANFGRQNSQHPHAWAFVDEPLILNRAFGPDGLRGIGAQVSWLAPLPYYTELSLGVLDGQGGTAFGFRNPGDPDSLGVDRFHGRATIDRGISGPQDLVYVPRLSTSFDLTDTQTIVLGTSGAFGSNDTGEHDRTEIYGTDIYWKWKPANAQEGFPFVSWQTEALYQRFGAGADPTAPGGALPGENLRDYGFYSQVQWGFRPRWVAGLRGEYVTGNKGAYDASDIFRGDRTRVAPMLTWFPTEFSKIRLQYDYDQGEYFKDAHSIWLQMEFLLGSHGAHKY
jgi:hypothetical protein